MNKDEFLSLETTAAPDEKIKLRILYDAMIETLKDYKSKYSQTNLRAWQAAETALDHFAASLQTNQAASVEFNTVKEVFTYLQSKAPLTNQSTVYNHFKKGFLRKNNNDKFSILDVDAYAVNYVKNFNQVESDATADQHNKFEADARKSAAQADHWELKTLILSGEYIERAAFERALARRAAVFKSDIENFIRTHSAEMINIVKGQQIFTPDIIDFWLQTSQDWLSRYSEQKEFEIPKAIDLNKLKAIEN